MDIKSHRKKLYLNKSPDLKKELFLFSRTAEKNSALVLTFLRMYDQKKGCFAYTLII